MMLPAPAVALTGIIKVRVWEMPMPVAFVILLLQTEDVFLY